MEDKNELKSLFDLYKESYSDLGEFKLNDQYQFFGIKFWYCSQSYERRGKFKKLYSILCPALCEKIVE